MSVDLSATMLDYLAEAYRLTQRSADKNGFVSTSGLADRVGVSAPAVNRMITKLKAADLLEHEPYHGIRLTNTGQHVALIKLRHHRIVEAFLVNVMGFAWHEVYQEAHDLSGALSEIISQRMLEMAGQPRYCPHGEPIPSEQGTIEEIKDVLLNEGELNQPYVVTRVLTREPDRLEYITALELIPGASVELIHAAPFNGPLQLKLKDEYRIIGHNLADLIRVKPA